MMGTRRRKRAISLGAIVTVAAMLAACSASSVDSDTAQDHSAISGEVIWADYGGPTGESRDIAYFEGFREETGVDVTATQIQDSKYFPMLEGEEGEYDVFQADGHDLYAYPGHMLELPEEARGDLISEGLQPYVAGGFVVGIAQGWMADTFPNGGPQNWADFFDVEKYPGKRAWPGYGPGGFDASFEIALLADGVAPEDLYPLDLDRAVRKLDTIRDDLIFYQSIPETQQLLTSGSASIAVTVVGQFQSLQNAGEDVEIQWNEAFSLLGGFVIPEKASNPEASMALATWMNDPENQAVFTERTLYGPVNSEVFEYLPDDVADRVVNSPAHDNLIPWDDKWRGENLDLLRDTYAEWLNG